jgi:transposase
MGGEWIPVMPKPASVSSLEAPESVEVTPPRRKRRSFSPAEKLRIVKAAEACRGQRGAVEEICRREGIYSSHLSNWRQAIEAHGVEGLAASKPGRKRQLDDKDVKYAALQKKAARLEKDLELAHKLLALQKKVSEILGITLATPEAE